MCVCVCVWNQTAETFDSAHMYVLSEHIHPRQLSIVRYLSVRSLRLLLSSHIPLPLRLVKFLASGRGS